MTYDLATLLFVYDRATGRLLNKISRGRTKRGQESGWEQKTTDGNVYRYVAYRGVTYLTHRIVWLLVTGKLPESQVDHIDGNGLNNKLTNLREATNLVNGKNTKKHKNNTSGVMGVGWFRPKNKWRARIYCDGKDTTLGYFDTIEEAIIVRKQAEIQYNYHPNHGRE